MVYQATLQVKLEITGEGASTGREVNWTTTKNQFLFKTQMYLLLKTKKTSPCLRKSTRALWYDNHFLQRHLIIVALKLQPYN